MNLCDHLSERTIATELEATEKNQAIAELGEFLKGCEIVRDHEQFVGAMFSREMEGTTGIGEGVAIPHARTDSVTEFVAALGRSSGGIDFQAVDGKPVHLIVMMGVPTKKVKDYLKLLAHLSLLVKQKDFTRRMLDAPDAAAMLETLRSFEQ
ncbi:MAG: PTS sugar transporter subunit IIA [Planctomycetota bacterium]